jgi:asparagine synthase (glutamine-hydrolysing)
MTKRAGHRHVAHVGNHGALGFSGPAIFDDTATVLKTTDCRTCVSDGEVYHTAGGSLRHAHESLALKGPASLATLDAIAAGAQLSTTGRPVLTLFSDRYGSRRLYYADFGDWFVFASELAPFAAWLGRTLEFDWQALRESVSFGSAIGDRTWLQHVQLFPPATVARVTLEGCAFERFWSWADVPAAGTNARSDRFEQLHALWQSSIRTRLRGARVGLQLSGGLDSRLILAEARAQRADLTTVTYGEPGADDVRFARRAAAVADVPWTLWQLPGPQWLERRARHVAENDGVVDIVNAHHAGLSDVVATLMDVELSGHLGDAVMGGTGLNKPLEWAVQTVPFWPSPIGISFASARERIEKDVRQQPSAFAWMFENKWRRAINGWPHVAVNTIDVRKPFLDYALLDFCAGLPAADRQAWPQRELLRRFYPSLATVPWQKTGVAPNRGGLVVAAMRGVRTAYRTTRRIAARAGYGMSPWVRNACDVNQWCADPQIRASVEQTVTDSAALVREVFDVSAIRETIVDAFDRRTVPVEVPLNLYRAEHVLQRLRRIATEAVAHG